MRLRFRSATCAGSLFAVLRRFATAKVITAPLLFALKPNAASGRPDPPDPPSLNIYVDLIDCALR